MIKIGNSISNISFYSCQPKTRDELIDIIDERIDREGPNCDLNDIDVSLITDMSWLFYNDEFKGNISKWDVSNVEDMESMFVLSLFNHDISNWNISNVEDMSYMFGWSRFNKDISNWNIREDCNTNCMFLNNVIKEEYKPKSIQQQ